MKSICVRFQLMKRWLDLYMFLYETTVDSSLSLHCLRNCFLVLWQLAASPRSPSTRPMCPACMASQIVLLHSSIRIHSITNIHPSFILRVHIIQQIYSKEIFYFMNHYGNRTSVQPKRFGTLRKSENRLIEASIRCLASTEYANVDSWKNTSIVLRLLLCHVRLFTRVCH